MESRLSPRAKVVVLWLAIGLAVLLLSRVPHIFSPFLWAVVTAYVLQPLISAFQRVLRLPRAPVAFVLYIGLVALLVFTSIRLFPLVREQAIGLITQLPATVQVASDQFQRRFPNLLTQFGLDPVAIEQELLDTTTRWASEAPREVLSAFTHLVSLLIEFFVYLFATFFFMLHGDRIIANLRDFLPRRYHKEFNRVAGEINRTLGRYLRGQALLVLIMSSATYVALSILGVHYAVILAIATGFLELIPILGPWSAGTIAVIVTLFDPTPPFGWSNVTLAIVVAVTYFVLRQAEDILVIPTLIGRIVHLHPLLVIFILLIGTAVGGILGLLLAVPTAAVLRILTTYVYGKVVAEEERRILLLDSRERLLQLMDDLPDLINHHLVLLPQPGLLGWDDLPIVQRLATEAKRQGLDLTVVTQDPVAASLATAVGLPTTAIPAGSPTALVGSRQ
jgi:predicted PurR-regulated permease PerM